MERAGEHGTNAHVAVALSALVMPRAATQPLEPTASPDPRFGDAVYPFRRGIGARTVTLSLRAQRD